jgi:hypothetical protein
MATFPSMHFVLTPEERQILGITEEDISSFTDENIQLTPREIDEAIEEIIVQAYEKSPVFRKLVDEDVARDHNRLGRSSKVVSKFLKHLRGILSPERRTAIKDDTFGQAHDMVRGVLHGQLKRPMEPQKEVSEDTIEPVSESEFSLFQIPGSNFRRDQLSMVKRWEDVRDPVLYFLGRYRDPVSNKLIKNEATKKMPDDLKIAVLSKFLSTIRSAKLEASGGKLSPSDERWLGRDLRELQMIARSLVVPSRGKPDTVYQHDLIEVHRQIGEVLTRLNKITALFKTPKFRQVMTSLMDVIDSALPSASLFEDRIKSIQDEIADLGLSKSQVSALVEVDPDTLTYNDPVAKLIDEQRTVLSEVTKEIARKGENEDLMLKRKNIEAQLRQLEELQKKDISGLRTSIEDYLSTLRAYKTRIKEEITDKKLTEQPVISDFVTMVDQMVLEFNRLLREALFKARWAGRSGILYRGEEHSPEEGEEGLSKEAGDATGYASKVERFRGKGIADAYNEIADILESEGKLPEIKEKLLSVMELAPGDTLNDTGEDYTNNPLGGKGMSISDAATMMNRLRSLIKRIKLEDKGDEALDILRWAATLQNHIKGGRSKKVKEKMAYSAYVLRKFARMLLGEDGDGKGHHKYQGGGGSDQPYKNPGRAGWIIFRERMTKFGKKALQSFFDEPTFVPDFIEAMEKEGLNRMLLHGGKEQPVPVDKVLQGVIQRSTGKKGDLGNILSSKVMQKYRAEHDIKKVEKDLEEAKERVSKLNNKISKTEERYLPKLESFGRFLKDPIGATKEQMEELRGEEKGKKKEVPLEWTGVIKPERIDDRNYLSVLHSLAGKYSGRLKKAEEVKKVDPSETSKLIPSEFLKKYLVWRQELKSMKGAVDKQDDPYRRALSLQRYYSHMLSVIGKLSAYMEYQKKVMEADKTTLERIYEFLDSEVGKKQNEKTVADARVLSHRVGESLIRQSDIFSRIERAHKDLKPVEGVVRDQLSILDKDISDKRVDMLYQVVVSPELTPDKETARRIKERGKEHEKGLSYIIDRYTYKRNMNKLMTNKTRRGPIKVMMSEGGKPVILSAERKREFEDVIRTVEEREKALNREADYGMKQVALDKMESDLRGARKSVDDGRNLIDNYRSLLENLDYLRANKDTMDPVQFKKEWSALSSAVEGKGFDINTAKVDIKQDIAKEEQFLNKIDTYINEKEKEIEEYRGKMKKPPMNLQREIKKLTDELYRLKGVEQQRALKVKSVPEQIALLEDKARRLEEMEKVELPVRPGTPEEQAFKRFREELQHQINLTGQDLQRYRSQGGVSARGVSDHPMEVQAVSDTEFENMSPYEKALETKGLKPAPYMEELKKPKGWELVENFFNEIKREHSFLRDMREEGKGSAIRSDYLKRRLSELENMAEAIDAYKNQLVNIGGDQVAFRDIMMEFEDTLDEYEQLIRKFINQRDDAVNKVSYLQQERDHLAELYDPSTGEFKGLGEEEVNNIKGIFLRMLYRDLERYWATRVGKDLSVFGERDTEWYNNVYRTFKNLADAKSNKKMLSLINKYKQETRSDFDDIANRLKSEELMKRLDVIIGRYKEVANDNLDELGKKREEIVDSFKRMGKDPGESEALKKLDKKIEMVKVFGVDPKKSESIKELITKITTLKKQEGQIDRIFKEMAIASASQVNADIAESIAEEADAVKVEGERTVNEKPVEKLKEQAKEKVDEVVGDLEKDIDELVGATTVLDEVETALDAGEKKLGISRPERPPVREPEVGPEEQIEKVASVYDCSHPDFNLNILYGKHMQGKIAEFLSSSMV